MLEFTLGLEAEIKEKALSLGARAVGIASVKDINRFAPPGHRPDDLLKGAKSVIVIAGGEPSAGAWRAGEHRVLASIGYNRSPMSSAARRMSMFMEETYRHYTIPIPSGNKVGHTPYISLKLCAEHAGLGTRSMAGGVILNEKHGLLYFNGVITTMALEEDGALDEPVCPAPSCVSMWDKLETVPCIASCTDCLSGEIRDGRIESMTYRQDLCYTRAQSCSQDALQKLLLTAINEPDPENRRAILLGSHFVRAVRSVAYSSELSAQCFNCLKRCPLVLQKNHGMR